MKTAVERLAAILDRHPRNVTDASFDGSLFEFVWSGWKRKITIGNASMDLFGLVELMDNNPLVCADEISIPNPSQTLALIALGPLADSGMIADTPRLIANCVDTESQNALARAGYGGPIDYHFEPMDLSSVVVLTAMVEVTTPIDPSEISEVFDERFGRSFFVRRDETSEWAPELVRNQPFAVYRVHVAADRPRSLVTVRVMADLHGKCGVSQIIHAMNVMCGFEESLGIDIQVP